MTCRLLFSLVLLVSLSTAPRASGMEEVRAVTWEKITREEPNPEYDLDAAMIPVRQQLIAQGQSGESLTFNLREARRFLEHNRNGTVERERQTWLTDGVALRKDFFRTDCVSLPQHPPLSPQFKGYTLERGGLYVQVTTSFSTSRTRTAQVNYPSEEAMLRTDERGNSLRCLLTGASLDPFLSSPLVTEQRAVPEGTVLTLKKRVPFRIYGAPIWIPNPLGLVVSNDGKRLLRRERLPYRGQPSWETTLTRGWSEVKPGLWLPKEIRVVSYSGSASGTRRVSRTETYRRLSVAVGGAVNAAPLHESFFSGRTSVRDNRFDASDPLLYGADRDPLSENEARRRYAKRQREKTLAVLLPQLLGVLTIGALAVGTVLKIRRGGSGE